MESITHLINSIKYIPKLNFKFEHPQTTGIL